eukprot:m.104590 g.104590  ORF g.104590 m.104590 type:complete len:436 (-) comp8891_c0_seq3:137-1444(-)
MCRRACWASPRMMLRCPFSKNGTSVSATCTCTAACCCQSRLMFDGATALMLMPESTSAAHSPLLPRQSSLPSHQSSLPSHESSLPSHQPSLPSRQTSLPEPPAELPPGFSHATCQVLRSMCAWSGGLDTEASIGAAYLALISGAKHYIYIENQFFISSLIAGPDTGPVNTISQALFKRICKAIDRQQRFRVLVFVPISPEGDFVNDMVVRFTMSRQFNTVCRGPQSLLGALEAKYPGVDLRDYVAFCSLRNAGTIDGKLLTDMIYVHSKIMIVDDMHLIVGSANINDRSMQGDRDSEIAAILSDEAFVDSSMNGKPYKAGRVAQSLRMNLWAEHFGGSPSDYRDPTSPATWCPMMHTAGMNTVIYERVFPNIPSDHVQSMRYDVDIRAAAPGEHNYLLACRRGHAVFYPLRFLAAGGFDVSMLDWTPYFVKDIAH